MIGGTEEREIDKLVCHISRWRGSLIPLVDTGNTPITRIPLKITCPFLSIRSLKAMHYWVLKRQCQGVPILVADCIISKLKHMLH